MIGNVNKNFNDTTLKRGLIFISLFLGVLWPQKLFFPSIILHMVALFSLIYFLHLKKNYNLLIYVILSLLPYFLNLNILTETLNPAVYVFLFLCGNEELNKKNDLSLFLLASLILVVVFIADYIEKFSIPFSYKDVYFNKSMLGDNFTLQSRWFGNIHNILPFVLTSSTFAIVLFLKGKNQIFAFLSFSIFYLFCYIYLGRLCLYYMFCMILLVIVKKTFDFRNHLFFQIKEENRKLDILKCLLGFLSIIFICISLSSLNSTSNNYVVSPLKNIIQQTTTLIEGDHLKTPSPNTMGEEDASLSVRLNAFSRGLQLLTDNFIRGVGPSQYYLYDPIYTSPHNFIIKLIVENGIIGLFFLILVIFKTIKSINRDFYWFPMVTFLTYSTLMGADLIVGRLCVNYILLTFLFVKICSSEKEPLKFQESFRKKPLKKIV